jgi:hypothetical protein
VRSIIASVQTFVFRCPTTGHDVQASHEGEPVLADRYIAHQCAACSRIHLVNPSTGRLAVEERLRPDKPIR